MSKLLFCDSHLVICNQKNTGGDHGKTKIDWPVKTARRFNHSKKYLTPLSKQKTSTVSRVNRLFATILCEHGLSESNEHDHENYAWWGRCIRTGISDWLAGSKIICRFIWKMKKRKIKQTMTKEALRENLEKMFSAENPLISRHHPLLNEMVAWGTLANLDSEMRGISERIIIGNRTFYTRTATIDWLVSRAKG